MNQEQVDQIILLLIKIAAIIVLIFNAGIGAILLRQISVMNSIVKVRGSIIITMIFLFLVVVVLSLVYAVLV